MQLLSFRSFTAELKETIDNVYQNIFGIAQTEIIEDQLLKLQIWALDDASVIELAQHFIIYSNNDNLEKFFRNISKETLIK